MVMVARVAGKQQLQGLQREQGQQQQRQLQQGWQATKRAIAMGSTQKSVLHCSVVCCTEQRNHLIKD
jgi:hypothetical protein